MQLEQGRTGKEENMKVLHLILEDGNGNHLHLSQKKILALVDKIVRAFNPRGGKDRIVVYFSYQDVVDG